MRNNIVTEDNVAIDETKRIAVIGGGIAGCKTALELARKDYQVTIVERDEDILRGTSARTPGRMGLGYHYFHTETAIGYMENTIEFMKEYYDCFLGDDQAQSYLRDGRYFITTDSLIGAQNLLASYGRIGKHFEKMCRKDSKNDIFKTYFLHEFLEPEEYCEDIDQNKVLLAIETKERLLDWKKFEERLKREIKEFEDRGLIKVETNFEVKEASMAEGGKFLLSRKKSAEELKALYQQYKKGNEVQDVPSEIKADYVVNCTWQNIEQLNQRIGIGDSHLKTENSESLYEINGVEYNVSELAQVKKNAKSKRNLADNKEYEIEKTKEPIISRLKLLAEVKLPESLRQKHSMFFCVGPHAMFSNLGNGIGRITYAPVTNFGTTTESQMPEQFERWLKQGLSEEESRYYGQEIISGVAQYIPSMKDAELISVIPGIVKSKGDFELNNVESAFHKRDYSGVEEQQIGWADNAAMKLFYCIGNAKEVVKIISKQELAKDGILSIPELRLGPNLYNFFTNYLQRNFTVEDLNKKSEGICEKIVKQGNAKKNLIKEITNVSSYLRRNFTDETLDNESEKIVEQGVAKKNLIKEIINNHAPKSRSQNDNEINLFDPEIEKKNPLSMMQEEDWRASFVSLLDDRRPLNIIEPEETEMDLDTNPSPSELKSSSSKRKIEVEEHHPINQTHEEDGYLLGCNSYYIEDLRGMDEEKTGLGLLDKLSGMALINTPSRSRSSSRNFFLDSSGASTPYEAYKTATQTPERSRSRATPPSKLIETIEDERQPAKRPKTPEPFPNLEGLKSSPKPSSNHFEKEGRLVMKPLFTREVTTDFLPDEACQDLSTTTTTESIVVDSSSPRSLTESVASTPKSTTIPSGYSNFLSFKKDPNYNQKTV